ncbi:MAG: bifunctional 2-keto-4-hydroxyglutarate aldolase/2-keto-3-deoxy-6-phosphogluconate aldolase, partial [Leptospiraceae bacterium]|nr:bifunctional 2-keto-4-hydroxyglutarate aldolase/2-keto-3-deoxy-6-phosphogluconate aldolase [Leptospiraceae bacterium]
IKLFPGKESGGPGFVKAIKGPLPRTAIMPTGGVAPDRESLSEWFEAGVTCVGMGSALLRKDLIAAGDFTTLEQNIRAALELIKEIRAGK